MSKKCIATKIVSSHQPLSSLLMKSAINSELEALVADGWEPIGGISVTYLESKGLLYAQTMAKYADDSGISEEQLRNIKSILNTYVDKTLYLTVRAQAALKRMNITTVGELVKTNEKSLLASRNMGLKTIEEIKKALDDRYGLRLGMSEQKIQEVLLDYLEKQ